MCIFIIFPFVSSFNHSVSIILVGITNLWPIMMNYIYIYQKPILYQRKKKSIKMHRKQKQVRKERIKIKKETYNTPIYFTVSFYILYLAYVYDTMTMTNKAHKVIILIRHKVNHISWCDPYTNSGAPPWRPMSVYIVWIKIKHCNYGKLK